MDVMEKLVELPIEDAILILREEHQQRTDGYATYLAHGGKGDPAEEVSLDALAMAISALEKTKWIPVTDRLPDEHESLFARYKGTDKWLNEMFMTISDPVIVCAEYENGKRIVKTANMVDGVWKVKDILCPCRVTHWMPLPEPPEETLKGGDEE